MFSFLFASGTTLLYPAELTDRKTDVATKNVVVKLNH